MAEEKRCLFYDFESAAELSRVLQRGLARCLKTIAERSELNGTWSELCTVVEKRAAEPVEEGSVVAVLTVSVDEFVKGKLSGFQKLSNFFKSKTTNESNVEEVLKWLGQLQAEDEAKGNDPAVDWDREAVQLIRAADDASAHCQARFSNDTDRGSHVLECPLRPVPCGNTGCDVMTTVAKLATHDLDCPFKVLPCPLHCTGQLCRKDIEQHTQTVCPMKPVQCPYHRLGCAVPLVQGEMQRHLANADHHLWLAVQLIATQGQQIKDLQATVGHMEAALAVFKKDVGNCYTRDINGLKKDMGRLQSDTKHACKQWKNGLEALRKEQREMALLRPDGGVKR